MTHTGIPTAARPQRARSREAAMADHIAQYDEDAAQHYLGLPLIRKYAEYPTLKNAVGSLRGKQALDLACGTGIYTRALLEWGAERVVGVDAAADMLRVAGRLTPAGAPITYEEHDVRDMPFLGAFDVVTAVFLLNYARSREQLDAMCERIVAHLKPGGRFAGSITNSGYDPEHPHDTRYQVTYGRMPQHADGDTMSFTLYDQDRPITLETVYWTNETYRAALSEAGLVDVEVSGWQVSEEGVAEYGAEFWAPWVASPALAVVTGRLPE